MEREAPTPFCFKKKNAPLADAHGEGVEVLVELVEERDALDDHVVGPPGVELDLCLGCFCCGVGGGVCRRIQCRLMRKRVMGGREGGQRRESGGLL